MTSEKSATETEPVLRIAWVKPLYLMKYNDNSCFEILWFESNSILNWFFHSPLITLFLKMCLFIIFWSLWIKRLNNCPCYSYTRLSMRRLLVRLMVEIFQFLRLKLLTTWRLFVLHDYFVLCEKLFMPIINAPSFNPLHPNITVHILHALL